MHRRPAALVCVVIAALASVSACTVASSSDGSTPRPSGDSALPTVTGNTGAPYLTFPSTPPPDGLVTEVLADGSGATVHANDILVADYVGQVWNGSVFDSSYTRGSVLVAPLSSLVPAWADGLTGRTVGSRVLISAPPSEGYGAAGSSAAGISGTSTIVFVVDILGSFGATASGDPSATSAGTPPAGVLVSGPLGSPPSIQVVSTTPQPTVATTTVLATGSGPTVTSHKALVQIAATDWDGSNPGSTWLGSGPIQVSVDPGAPFAGLAGTRVGSRVVVLVPASGTVPAVAAVVDVLARA